MDVKTSNNFYHVISAAFCTIVIISNIISAKMVQLPFGFILPAGLLTYPLTFLISDFVTEIYGSKKARSMVYLTLMMNLLSFGIIYLSLNLPSISESENIAFKVVLGLSGLRIFSSLVAFLVAQIVDIQLYALIKHYTGLKFLWLRNNGSTCISQIVDTVTIDMIYLYWGLGLSLEHVMPIMLASYTYKAFFSFACTPLFYLSISLTKMEWKYLSITPRALYESKI